MTGRTAPLVVTPVTGMPEITAEHGLAGLARLISEGLRRGGLELVDGDVLVLSSKVVSKALGLRAPAGDKAAVVLAQSRRVVAERRTDMSVTRVVEALAGPVMAAAGVDASNTGSDELLLLPDDPDTVAQVLLEQLLATAAAACGADVGRGHPGGSDSGGRDPGGSHPGGSEAAGFPRIGLVLSDTSGRPWRAGQTDFALGAAGLAVLDDLRGATDADGRPLSVTMRCLADELASAADLVKGKDRHVALAHVRGLESNSHRTEAVGGMTGARALVRTGPGDWFSHGTYEAVRAALGVEPASPEAERIGIPSTDADQVGARLARAAALAVLGLEAVTTKVSGGHLELASDDPVALGVVLGRLSPALWAERLSGTIELPSGRPGEPGPRTRVTVEVRERD
ncbi:coenzyme F420-0:L-glutamate ligase [Segeticoccus rhizosphaerae]|jgi:coenzyme F420-0:L-glutamate ligase/coenzyme F420-1:gamma-L-glutamate ligase|uniref:coenzyme F420-0:L-glutamate ligase n=3 Tax=Segeticoccus rhizosphaerae TaxID=1104777 RepID=UPI001EE3B2CA|nr:coenzyme F420-0:L-glutamate ligase [Ornithinicoccus soli]